MFLVRYQRCGLQGLTSRSRRRSHCGHRLPVQMAVNLMQQQARFDNSLGVFRHQHPHEAPDRNYPAELHQPSPRVYTGLPNTDYPFHDRMVVGTRCGRTCLGKKKINFSTVFAGQPVGIKEVDDDIWLVSSTEYDLGYFDLETRVLEPLENPFRPKGSPM